MAYAGLGLLLSDKAEESFGLVPSEQDRERLREIVPRITVVDKSNQIESDR